MIRIGKSVLRKIAVIATLIVCSLNLHSQNNIIPKPVSTQATGGYFTLDGNVVLKYDRKAKEIAGVVKYFAEYINNISGYSLPVNKKATRTIEFLLSNHADVGNEGYVLKVSPMRILVEANTKEGLFYGIQSLIQSLPGVRTNDSLKIACVDIRDYPRFGWRGMMLDVSRHFYSVDAIKGILDLLALYKMNVFHWHLVDNEGWRLEIKKYPKLTEIGAWRNEVYGSVWYSKDSTLDLNDTHRYGGYYTQDQAKEIVEYAKLRNITVVPEIEMPGHSGAALAAYPQFSCNQLPQPVPNSTVVNGFKGHRHVNMEYCAGNDSSFLFLQDILKEVMAIFPSEYIHVGGDEVEKFHWQDCEKCRKRMKDENLQDERELQSYFIRRMEKFLSINNRKLLGWDEILEGGLAPSAAVMSWRGEEGGIQAARMKHEVVMSPSNPLYFNRYQADPVREPHAARYSINTLDKVYHYNPHSALLTAEEQKLIKGGECAIWTEFISSVEHLEYMLLPRLPALSEALWTPVAGKDYNDFVKRLNQWHYMNWGNKGIRFHQALYKK